MPIVEAENLTKTYRVFQKRDGLAGAVRGLFRREYRQVKAVESISFAIEPGEMVAFLGPNGAGKTTTLKMLSGLIYPSGGSAQVLGFTPSDRVDRFRRQFALVMGQKNQLWWDLPAADSFDLHREIYQLPLAEYRETLDELTTLLDVARLTHQPVRELSLGERMKMELIAALLHRPRLLLLDEPTIGLDVVAQVTIQRCLKEYHARRGVTMLLTSHYMRDVEALCDRVLVINHGRLIYDGDLPGLSSRFGQSKLIKLEFAEGEVPSDLSRFGEVDRNEGGEAEIRVDRSRVAEVLGAILDRYRVADVVVQDPPLEQVITRVFQEGREGADHDAA
ncbi:ABC transporter ATP-binding protein [Tautonia marina]|uniref:ABC transporter ATP-binding protein n=1 Tax=Tautonia marina TaxID=2653855 RepID=UPI0012613897|nr:ATP-binding cassette domain-containing protein [Tautonia marina]